MSDSTNPKDLLGIKKVSMAEVPPIAIAIESLAMMDGALKYGHRNWRDKKVSARIYVNACLRHLYSWLEGEDVSQDAKVHHLGHARACLGIILDAQANGTLLDDRVKGPLPKSFDGINEWVMNRVNLTKEKDPDDKITSPPEAPDYLEFVPGSILPGPTGCDPREFEADQCAKLSYINSFIHKYTFVTLTPREDGGTNIDLSSVADPIGQSFLVWGRVQKSSDRKRREVQPRQVDSSLTGITFWDIGKGHELTYGPVSGSTNK